ncbi:unnamed protein product [Rotaria sp. Silwood2]|nr:unnamed protein product [Rotaria sp. Silwood2]CAF4563072.1 unnamed protein product [Rotaria sp. Silwood2]
MATNDYSEEIVKLILLKNEHEDTIKILQEQDITYEGETDHRMNELKIIWRQKEYESITAKIQYLRYKQAKLDELAADHDQRR